jgi:hypothetical protein
LLNFNLPCPTKNKGGTKMLKVNRLGLAFLLTVSLLLSAASLAQRNQQDGLINVAIYDITVVDGDVVLVLNEIISNVDVGVAAQIAANVCGVKVGPLAVLGRAVDRSGDTATACETSDQVVQFVQN